MVSPTEKDSSTGKPVSGQRGRFCKEQCPTERPGQISINAELNLHNINLSDYLTNIRHLQLQKRHFHNYSCNTLYRKLRSGSWHKINLQEFFQYVEDPRRNIYFENQNQNFLHYFILDFGNYSNFTRTWQFLISSLNRFTGDSTLMWAGNQ